jgi:hypothetical protein
MRLNRLKIICTFTSGVLLALIQTYSYAADNTDPFRSLASDTQEYLQLADNDDRQDRRDERGRSDERQDKRDCRQDEGVVGKDKRDCKQEEVRDGVRGNQGGSDNDD